MELLKIDDPLERSFYEKECANEHCDLKRGEIQHEDIGQMNFYLNYYREEKNTEGDTEPIGIVLGAYNNRVTMQYALRLPGSR